MHFVKRRVICQDVCKRAEHTNKNFNYVFRDKANKSIEKVKFGEQRATRKQTALIFEIAN